MMMNMMSRSSAKNKNYMEMMGQLMSILMEREMKKRKSMGSMGSMEPMQMGSHKDFFRALQDAGKHYKSKSKMKMG